MRECYMQITESTPSCAHIGSINLPIKISIAIAKYNDLSIIAS